MTQPPSNSTSTSHSFKKCDDGSYDGGFDRGGDGVSRPRVELVLSRSAYRCGDTVCGTVRLFVTEKNNNQQYCETSADDRKGSEVEENYQEDNIPKEKSRTDSSSSDVIILEGTSTARKNNNNSSARPNNYRGNHESIGNGDYGDYYERQKHNMHLREIFTYATVHISGKCRLDHRWHPGAKLYNAAAASASFPSSSSVVSGGSGRSGGLGALDLYGKIHPLLVDLPEETKRTVAQNEGMDGTIVCFFATNCVDLLSLPERVETKPREPYRFQPRRRRNRRRQGMELFSNLDVGGGTEHELNGNHYENKHEHDVSDEDNVAVTAEDRYVEVSPQTRYGGEGRAPCHLAFTFQVRLPDDLPHSIQATCCRYFYSAVVSVRTAPNGEVLTVQVPFVVLSCARFQQSDDVNSKENERNPNPSLLSTGQQNSSLDKAGKQTSGRVKVGLCKAMAHSFGLPCYVSPATLDRRTQMGVSSTGLCSTMTARDVKSMRVANADGVPICVLTLVGSDVLLIGGRVLLHFSFEKSEDDDHEHELSTSSSARQPRCLQICSCLRGEEIACFGDARATTKSYIFDARHALVCEDTDSIAMNLSLPMDCPTTLCTDLVEILMICQIELTVEKVSDAGAVHGDTYGSGGGGGCSAFDVLRLDLPCKVVHSKIYRDDENSLNYVVGDGGDGNFLNSSLQWLDHDNGNNTDRGQQEEEEEVSQDLLNDLTMLSIRMIEDST